MQLANKFATDAPPAAAALTPAAVFGLLASMYLFKPTADAIGNWRVLMSEGAPEFLGELNEAINEINPKSEEEMQNLLWDFTRLFIGPYRLPSPPWESVYTSEKRLLLQEASDAVRAAYDQAGVGVGTSDILPDHVGAELSFVGILLEKIETSSADEEACRQLVMSFAKEHLSNWMPRFTSDLEKAAETSFYKALARSTMAVINQFSN